MCAALVCRTLMIQTGAEHLAVFLKSTEASVLPVTLHPTAKFTLILLHHRQPEKSIRKGESLIN